MPPIQTSRPTPLTDSLQTEPLPIQTSPPTLLTYSLQTEPLPIQVSPSASKLAVATLTVVVSCPRAVGTASVRQIEVSVPVDTPNAPPDPTNLAAIAPPAGCASISSSGSDTWTPSPGLPGVFTFAPKDNQPVLISDQGLTITLTEISVSPLVGTTVVTIKEWAATAGVEPPPTSGPPSSTVGLLAPKFPEGFSLGVFQATPPNIDPGVDPTCSTTLSWSGSDGASYTIEYDAMTIVHPVGQPDQPLPPQGSYQVANLQDDLTVFTLIVKAAGTDVSVQQQALVNVNRAKIESFVAFPPVLGQNASCQLTWVSQSDECYLGADEVSASGSKTITVADSVDLTLTAKKGQDLAQETRHVEVVPPVINSFQVLVNGTPVNSPVDSGTVVTLVWDTQYAETVTITPNVGTVDPSSDPGRPLTATVTNSTAFVLTCTGKGDPVTQQVMVAVNPVQITSFTVNPTTVDPGPQSVTLSWATVRATAASIDQGVGVVQPASAGSVVASINPQSDMGFTLTCNGPDGPKQASAGLTVNSVRITHFDWESVSSNGPNSNCTLNWSTELASRVQLAVDFSDVLGGFPANTPIDVGPSGSADFAVNEFDSVITFTLTASGPGSSPVSAQTYTDGN